MASLCSATILLQQKPTPCITTQLASLYFPDTTTTLHKQNSRLLQSSHACRCLLPPIRSQLIGSCSISLKAPLSDQNQASDFLIEPFELTRIRVVDQEYTLNGRNTSAELALVLDSCGKSKALSVGRRVHAHMSRYKHYQSRFLGNSLIRMYGRCGDVKDALAVFNSLPDVNSHSWNTLISAYVKNGHDKEALEFFHQMQVDGLKPDDFTFTWVVNACASLASLAKGMEIHVAILINGCEGDIAVGTALINMYGKCHCMPEARSVFGRLPQLDVVSWSVMITSCVKNGHAKEALDFFHKMEHDCILSDPIAFVSALDACASLTALDEGQRLHAAIVNNGFKGDVIVGTSLVNMYGKCGRLIDAMTFFFGMVNRNIVSWNAIVASCAQNGHGREALAFFHQMQLDNIKPDQISFVCALDACAGLGALKEGQEIHADIVDSGFEEEVIVATALVDMYGKCGSLHSARNVFGHMIQRNAVSWNAIVTAYACNGHGKEALELFHQMQLDGFKPDQITFASALDACTSLTSLEAGKEVHAAIVESGYEGDLFVGTTLIYMYGKCGSVHDAMRVFLRMPKQNVISWGAMIAACAEDGRGKEALDCFHQMELDGIKPSDITFVCALDACASLAALEEGQELHAAVVTMGFETDVFVGTALVNMYGKCGRVADAKSVFSLVSKRDSISWNAMIQVCAQNGQGKEALEYFHQMQEDGVMPNQITFLNILSACSHTGQVNEARQLFLSMSQDYSIPLMLEHYVCMIDLLGRSGHLDEAEDLINTMPFQKTSSAWSCLLSACRIHDDVERGIRAATQVFKLDSEDAAPYILLSNMCMAVERWDDGERSETDLVTV